MLTVEAEPMPDEQRSTWLRRFSSLPAPFPINGRPRAGAPQRGIGLCKLLFADGQYSHGISVRAAGCMAS
jgi:hypothetical protein